MAFDYIHVIYSEVKLDYSYVCNCCMSNIKPVATYSTIYYWLLRPIYGIAEELKRCLP